MKIRDRIRELRRVRASELLPNPKNWRTHPAAQADALRGVLAEVGMADAEVPVLVLDVDEAEADKILATLDPLAAMANSDAVKLDELLRVVDTGSDALQQMLADTAAQAGLYTDQWEGKPAQDPGEIAEYDPDNETVSIRLNDVPVGKRDEIVAAVDAAVASHGIKCEVF